MSKNNDSLSDVSDKVKTLKKGETFNVVTEKERKHALTAARVFGKRISTRRIVGGGFTVFAL